MRASLYRDAALKAQDSRWAGPIVAVRPPGFRLWTALGVGASLAVLAFLAFGSYAPRTAVTGRLLPDRGLIKVAPAQAGVVARIHVSEGQWVERGQVLFELDADRSVATSSGVERALGRAGDALQARGQSLVEERERAGRRQSEQRAVQLARVDTLEADIRQLSAQIDAQTLRIGLLREVEARYKVLSDEGIVSRDQWQLKQAEVLSEGMQLTELRRKLDTLRQDALQARHELKQMPLQHQDTLAELDRRRAQTDQELAEHRARRAWLVVAPQAGQVSSLLAELGQEVTPQRTLATVVPQGAQLVAQLQVPGVAMGFIREGDRVRLRYPAFPHQKYGQARGRVTSVARTAWQAEEWAAIGGEGASASPAGADSLRYRVTVSLPAQGVSAGGRHWPLQVGMQVEADVLREPMPLYQWVLAPLYAMKGRLTP